MTRFIYLAHPIDQDPDQHLAFALLGTRQQLLNNGIGSYDPQTAFLVPTGATPNRYPSQVNQVALGRSDGMIAWLPKGVPTVGTPREIWVAASNGKPVLIVADHDSWDLVQYTTWPNVTLTKKLNMEEVDAFVKAVKDYSGAAQAQPMLVAEARPDTEMSTLPGRHHQGDAGFDLTVSRDTTVQPGHMVDVPTNIKVQLPEGTWGLLVGRSSTLRTKQLQVHPGVIDGGYRGELFAAVSSISGQPVRIKAGERLAQLIVLHNASSSTRPVWAQALADSDRGANGFGSTGA